MSVYSFRGEIKWDTQYISKVRCRVKLLSLSSSPPNLYCCGTIISFLKLLFCLHIFVISMYMLPQLYILTLLVHGKQAFQGNNFHKWCFKLEFHLQICRKQLITLMRVWPLDWVVLEMFTGVWLKDRFQKV